jgi:quinol---cytochrome c reductase iron-sulfur subunit, bacillus type
VADELERPGGSPEQGESEPHLPSPTIYPIGFAFGLALVLVGLIVSWPVVAAGAAIALVFGFLWVRDVTSPVRRVSPEPEPAPPRSELEGDIEEEEEEHVYTRSRFLEASTLGLGAAIGGIVTVPAVGFMVAPAFVGQKYDRVDLGPLENYPEGEWMVATFFSDKEEGDVGRRTAFVRNNGTTEQGPSFTIISNRCAHLGCPTQPQGPSGEGKKIEAGGREVALTPTQPSGFGCPCHGGAYDSEGNRIAGPPVRALDRYEYLIENGNLLLAKPYSVGKVSGQGADAKIEAYRLADPGQHVDGPEQILYPIVP